MQKFIFIFLLSSCVIHAYSQVDFNNYHTLKCSGNIPDAVKMRGYEKVNQLLSEGNFPMKNDIDQLNYLTRIVYAHEVLLKTGEVIFGDPVSVHMQTIADKLLSTQPAIRTKLHFYTFKSAIAGIRITEFGDVFTSTGVVAQVINDAQLAFLLAHEIAHFIAPPTESATLVNVSKTENFFTHSYSIAEEQKADQWAENLLIESGFSSQYNAAALDVLLYSFLPFEDIPISSAYFLGDSLNLPNSLLPASAPPIGLDEKIIKRRTDWSKLTQRKIGLTTKKVGALYVKDSAGFTEIRTVSRFECVRSWVLSANPANAIYGIFLLEKEYPNSLFLKRMKALSWTVLSAYARAGENRKLVPEKLMWQGEIAKIYTMCSRLPFEYSAALTLKIILDCQKETDNDPEIDAIFQFFVNTLGRGDDFHTEVYKKDSIYVTDLGNNSSVNHRRSLMMNQQLADSLRFLYPIASEAVADPSFFRLYNVAHNTYLQQGAAIDSIKLLPRRQQRAALEEKQYTDLEIGMKKAIIFQPQVRHYSSLGVDHVKSEMLEKDVINAFFQAANSAGIEIAIPGDASTLKGVNECLLLSARVDQIQRNTDIPTFPVDYQEMLELIDEYGIDKLLLSSTDNRYFVEFNDWVLGIAITLVPAPVLLSTYLPIMLMTSNSTTFKMGIYDLNSGEKTASYSIINNVPLNTYNLSAEIYIAFRFLQKEHK